MKDIRCVGYARSAMVGPVQAQEDEIRGAAQCLGANGSRIRLLEVLRESGRSGLKGDRPQLKKLLRGIRRGEVDAVLVTGIDRLTRSLKQFEGLIRTFRRQKVRLISLRDGLDTGSASGRARMDVLLGLTRGPRRAGHHSRSV